MPYSNRNPDPMDLDSATSGSARAGTEFVGVREYMAMILRHWWVVIVVAAVAIAYTANSAMKE